MPTEQADAPAWRRVERRAGLRRVCSWAGADWSAWHMGGDRWLLEVDGRDTRLPLMDWPAVDRQVTAWSARASSQASTLVSARDRRPVTDVPLEDRPW